MLLAARVWELFASSALPSPSKGRFKVEDNRLISHKRVKDGVWCEVSGCAGGHIQHM